jgi:hypothetical protein
LTLKPFWIGKYEVTWGEFIFYYACPLEDVDGRSTASLSLLNISIPGNYFEHDRPVVALRWHSAMAYCRWLSKKTGHLYRLPTEVEWEYACQAGSDKAAPENLGEYAWFVKNSDVRTHMGGGKMSNAFGIHDMLGNVWEYCLESYKPPDFVPVFRGGGWDSPADELRANRRQPLREEWFERDPSRPRSGWWLIGGASQGFRIVRVADASDTRDREAYSSKIEINVLRHKEIMTTIGSSKEPYVRVWGQVKNAGDRLLQELHILICFLDNEGRRHLMDKAEWGPMQRPTYAYCFPVLVHSFHPGTHREPLRPAETRDFVVDLPMAYDEDVLLDKYSAQVAGLVFARD